MVDDLWCFSLLLPSHPLFLPSRWLQNEANRQMKPHIWPNGALGAFLSILSTLLKCIRAVWAHGWPLGEYFQNGCSQSCRYVTKKTTEQQEKHGHSEVWKESRYIHMWHLFCVVCQHPLRQIQSVWQQWKDSSFLLSRAPLLTRPLLFCDTLLRCLHGRSSASTWDTVSFKPPEAK